MQRWLEALSTASLLSQGPDLMVSKSRCLSGLFSNQVGDISPGTWAKTTWVHKAKALPSGASVISKSSLEPQGTFPWRQQGSVENSLKLPAICCLWQVK